VCEGHIVHCQDRQSDSVCPGRLEPIVYRMASFCTRTKRLPMRLITFLVLFPAGQSYTSSVDWWTVGVLAYEMMVCAGRRGLGREVCLLMWIHDGLTRVMVWAMQCGITPFKGENKKETFKQILYNDVAFPSDVEACVGRCVPSLPKSGPKPHPQEAFASS
jgi:serine/threonine protein kinase